MLKFILVRWRNLLSTGNTWSTVKLNDNRHTLIVGINGAGKTTILDAICFALYGKPFRAINKPRLVNSINEKECVVEIEFETGGHMYMVRRGIKPNVFEIFIDGKPLWPGGKPPGVKDEQDYLERHILKCNYKAFTQVVILGATNYVPFMKLAPAARREILEDVLDIEVFSIMHTLLKERISTNRDAFNKAQMEHALIEQRHQMAQNYAQQWEEQQLRKRDDIDTRLETIRSERVTFDERIVSLESTRDGWEPIAAGLDELQSKHTKANRLVAKFTEQRQHLEHSSRFFHDHEQCPMCTQVIPNEFKSDQLGTITSSLTSVKTELAQLEKVVASLDKKLVQAREAVRTMRDLDRELATIRERVNSLDREVARLNTERERTYDPPPPQPDLGDIGAVKAVVDNLTYEKFILEQGQSILKDNGIRTKIIQHHLPIINRWVNHYLSVLDFPIQFILDEQFNETILSRNRDDFSYENFSNGEKMRIDIALLLTWRAIARMKNSVHTNLLIFDEVLDASIDAPGIEDLLRLIFQLEDDTNIFFISHRDLMIDKFSSVLQVEKQRGFSVIKALS